MSAVKMVIETPSENNFLQEVKYVPTSSDDEKLQPEQQVKRPDTLFLYFTVAIALIPWFVGGAAIVWASPAVEKLRSNDSEVNPLGRHITTVEISMVLGVPAMAGLFGSIFLPKLADIIGRRKSIQAMGLVMFISIIGVAFSRNIELIVICICSIAIAVSAIWGICPIYLTEICENHNRAKYCCIMALSFPLGELYTYLIGPPFSVRTFTLLIAAPLIIFLVLSFFIPESPVYILSKGQIVECKKVLSQLRSNKSIKELDDDFNTIQQALESEREKKGISIIKLFRSKEGRIGMMLGFLPITIQHLSGVPVVMPLMAPILNESGSNMSGDNIAIIVGVVEVCTYTFASLVVERVGRKPLLIASSIGAGTSVSILGLFFYLKSISSPFVKQYPWIPLVSMSGYITLYGLGLGPTPLAMISELFHSDLRSTASAIIMSTVGFIFSCYLLIYPLLAEAIGIHWCMWIFGSCCLIGSVLFYTVLPETKGKSISEIQEILKSY
ncbi:facilitated trehalose transporter Tret1-like [Diorhabda carinulata]|uniref:facilitated trehalose transporter Tret1-like n=1 Tax=Diorhabda carinulata TaxID=1163345 RepID=UPI0025A27DFB|nr:facilitated trehalose transporter Tret1-like [Diorhabda carinulata]